MPDRLTMISHRQNERKKKKDRYTQLSCNTNKRGDHQAASDIKSVENKAEKRERRLENNKKGDTNIE